MPPMFVTSLVIWSLTVVLFVVKLVLQVRYGSDANALSKFVCAVVTALANVFNVCWKSVESSLTEFKKLISGGGDDSLVSQIKLLKNDLIEQLKDRLRVI